MKHLIIILALLTACKKEATESFTPVPPCKVVYTVKSQTESTKHITGELWSAKQGTKEKSVLVARIDTFVTDTCFSITLIQNVQPTFYGIANLTVTGYDAFSLEIMSEGGGIGRGGSCATETYGIEDICLLLN